MMYGADSEELRALAARFSGAAHALQNMRAELTAGLRTVPWHGNDATTFRGVWNSRHTADLARVDGALQAAAETIRRQAAEQDDAARAGGGLLEPCRVDPSRDPRALLNSRTMHDFYGSGDPRRDVVEAFYATTDGRRVNAEEIEIRVLGNGRYVVVLPGVNDLTEGVVDGVKAGAIGGVPAAALAAGLTWGEGRSDVDSVRRIAHAEDAAGGADPRSNPYAQRVREAMERAGIPVGADVMLIGHSYGAYTAMDLAADDLFNARTGSDYHVNVTHVLAAGADTNWRMDDISGSTNVLVLNSTNDIVMRAEDVLQSDPRVTAGTHTEVEFAGGLKGAGHHPDNYANYLLEHPAHAGLDGFLDDAGSMYGGPGFAYSARVPDVD